MLTAAVIVAAGRGHRLGGETPKQYAALGGSCALRLCVDRFLALDRIGAVQLVIHPDDRPLCTAALHGLHDPRLLPPTPGADTRTASVLNGLEALAPHRPDRVLIHDAARPFVPAAVVAAVLDALDAAPGAFAALPVVDALWRAEDGRAEAPVPREGLWRAQTPQGFHFDRILAAHRACRGDAADDVAVARAAGLEVRIVPGSEANYKITTTADLARARADVARMDTGRGAADRGRRHRRLMDAILVVNAGSSSLKFQVFGPGLAPLVRGHIDGIGVRPRFRATDAAGALLVEQSHAPDDLPDLAAAIALAAGWLDAQDGLAIRAIGHRVVHGGPDFRHPVLIDAAVLDRLAGARGRSRRCTSRTTSRPIRLFMARLPSVPQVACFDTAFHRGHAPHTDCYALPRALYDEGVRRYGFHGLSYEYIADRLPEIAPAGRRAAASWSPTSATAPRMCALPGGAASPRPWASPRSTACRWAPARASSIPASSCT